jgi:hypothetical protein
MVLAGRITQRARELIVSAWIVALTATCGIMIGRQLGETHRLHEIIDRDCVAFRVSSSIPLPANAPPLAHRFVDSFREAYEGRCVEVGGPLPPAVTLPPVTPR